MYRERNAVQELAWAEERKYSARIGGINEYNAIRTRLNGHRDALTIGHQQKRGRGMRLQALTKGFQANSQGQGFGNLSLFFFSHSHFRFIITGGQPVFNGHSSRPNAGAHELEGSAAVTSRNVVP